MSLENHRPPEPISVRYKKRLEAEEDFVSDWISSHGELLRDVEHDDYLEEFLACFTTTKAWSFDHLMVELNSKIPEGLAQEQVGIALKEKLIKYDFHSGLITLAD